jgi:para-aminobenzoate synthetase/4-amino-4-deoxychorismate lyase
MHAVLQALEETGRQLEKTPHRIRLLVSRDGNSEIQTFPMEEGRACSPSAPRTAGTADPTLRVALAKQPVDSNNVFLYHKTTHRAVYEAAKAEYPNCDDVILWNERGEVTEGTIANVVVRKNGKLVTPPVSCGLLAGTFCAQLLSTGKIFEEVVTLDGLKAAEEVFLVNSVRKWQKICLK